MDTFLPYMLARANAIKEEEKVVKLYSRHLCSYDDGNNSTWGLIYLEHPSTFETMAMDHKLKKMIAEDLDSLITSMANYLKFDVYDLGLINLSTDYKLKRVLLCTINRSILVIEDIDCCSVDIQNRQSEKQNQTSNTKLVSLSGLLNFIDGLLSSFGDERILVFTTNKKDRLDPALLRLSRMDVHIHMLYCTISEFRLLASNYLALSRFPSVEQMHSIAVKVDE
ncbi:hypothetical protein ACFX19_018649 [Malus domestica]